MERICCGDIGNLLLEVAENASRIVGIRIGVGKNFGEGEIDIYRYDIGDDVSALMPIVCIRKFAFIRAIAISKDGNQLLVTGSEDLPIALICENLIDEVVEKLKGNNGVFCNSCGNEARARHWLIRRTAKDKYEYHVFPRNIKEVRFWKRGIISSRSDDPDKIYYLPEALVNDLCFSGEYWEFIYEIGGLRAISWRAEKSDIIVASCDERVVILGESGEVIGLIEKREIKTPGYNFLVRGITAEGWIIVTVSHKCKAADFKFELVSKYDLEHLHMLFCEHE